MHSKDEVRIVYCPSSLVSNPKWRLRDKGLLSIVTSYIKQRTTKKLHY